MDGSRNGTLPESRALLLIEVDEVFLVEQRPIRQRNIAILRRERVIDHTAISKGNAVDVDDAGDAIRPRVHCGMGDRATSGLSDEYDTAVGRFDGIDHCNDRVDVVAAR